MQIYLDNSATTKPRPDAIAKMQEILQSQWGNPSSLHNWGVRAATVLEEARMKVANLINAPRSESIVFTSGGTEANNLAIIGTARLYQNPQHIIISSAEHSAVAEPVKLLEQWGWQVSRLPVNNTARVHPQDLKRAIQRNTVLISIIYGQSEVGTIQPIEQLAKIAKEKNILFHTDAVQVAGRLPLDVQKLSVDLLSLSAHKIYSPQGSGSLYIRPGVELIPLFGGGGQEKGRRSGTEALPAIAAFGVAAEMAAAEINTVTPRLINYRDRLFDLLADCPYLKPSGDRIYRLPHHVSFVLSDTEAIPETITGKTLVRQLNLAGIAISAGSACNSGKLTPSKMLLTMGYDPIIAKTGIRFSLGRDTTLADIDWTAMVLKQILDRSIPPLITSRSSTSQKS